MSLKALTWAWDQAIPPIQKLVLVAIADYANTEDKTWYSVESIARKCNVHRSTAIRALHALEAAKLVSVEARPNKTNIYSLPLGSQPATTGVAACYPQGSRSATSQPATPSQPATTGVAESDAGGSSLLPDTVKNRNTVNIPDDQIKVLYDAYPRKISKPAALAAIRKALKREAAKSDLGMTFDALLEKTKLWATACSQKCAKDEDAAKYIKHPSTWFNQQCYLEDSADWDIKSVPKSWLEVEVEKLSRETVVVEAETNKMLAELAAKGL